MRSALQELAHYALATTDLEFSFPFGWDEIWGIANRGDFDLRAHSKASGHELSYRDPVSMQVRAHGQQCLSRRHRNLLLPQTFFPHAIEPALGINRLLLAILCDGLVEETLPAASGADGAEGMHASADHIVPALTMLTSAGAVRTVFRVKSDLAPFQAAVLPVVKRDKLVAVATEVHTGLLERSVAAEYDVTQSIGRRYRRQDAIGTPLCITVDELSVTEGSVTVRDRDSMAQVRVVLPTHRCRHAAAQRRLLCAGATAYCRGLGAGGGKDADARAPLFKLGRCWIASSLREALGRRGSDGGRSRTQGGSTPTLKQLLSCV